MKNKNKYFLTTVLSICLIALIVVVFIPRLLGDFLLNNRYLSLGVLFVAFVTCSGLMFIVKPKQNVENYVTDKGSLLENISNKPVVEKKVEAVVEETSPTVAAEKDEEVDEEETNLSIARVDYSFLSKLVLASDETKDYYKAIVGFATSYGVKVRKSWKKETIYQGRKVFALLTFKGKKLCVSFALNPANYENSKYFFKDVSSVKKFEKTPLLMKITSGRKVKYTKELLELIFNNNGLVNKNKEAYVEDIPTLKKEELIEKGLIKDHSQEKVSA